MRSEKRKERVRLDPPPTAVAPPPARRKGRKLFTFLLILAVFIALLPVVIAKTPLRDRLLSLVVPHNLLQLKVGDASLGWFTAPSLSAVEVKDSAGQLLLTAEAISTDRVPGTLLTNPRDLGVVQIVRPTLYVTMRPDGTNLEDVLHQLAATLGSDATSTTTGNAPSQPVAVAVQVIEGTILAEEVATGRRWRVANVDLQYDTHGIHGLLGRGKLSGQIETVGANQTVVPAGQFAISLQPGDAPGKQEFNCQAAGLELALVEPWLRRFVTAAEVSGVISAQGTASWMEGESPLPIDLVSSGSLTIDRLDATAPALAGDRVRLARVEMPWRLASKPAGIVIEDLQLHSELGQAAVRGVIDPAAWLSSTSADTATSATLAKHDVEMRGSLDLKQLAAMLPRAMRIREGTTITSGSVELMGRYQPADVGQLVTGSLRTANLTATNDGRPLSWDQPVNATFALRHVQAAWRVDTFQCDSDFLKIAATGTPQEFSATAQFDLNRLAEQLGQFVDLSGIEPTGTGTARVNWKQVGDEEFSAVAEGELSQLRVTLGDGAVWAEPQLTIRAESAGAIDPITKRPARVANGRAQLNGQGDQLDAQLTAPVELTSAAPAWPISVRASGSIARWLTRARPWLAMNGWQIDGQSELTTNVRVVNRTVDVTDTQLSINNLQATGHGWNINEPLVKASGDAHWDGLTGEVSATSAQFVTSAVSLAAKDVHYRPAQQGIDQLAGACAFRADLARLAAWQATPGQQPTYQTRGELLGNLRFAQQAGQITGELNANGQNFVLAQRSLSGPTAGTYETIWQEPQLSARGLANYDAAANRLRLDQFQVQSNTLQASASGEIEKLSTTADANLHGTVNYDLAQVTPLLRPYVGPGVQLTGREQARFALVGQLRDATQAAQFTTIASDPYRANTSPFSSQVAQPTVPWSRRLQGQLEVPWSGANVYGLPIGPGKLAAALGTGAIRIEPLSLTVGEGTLTAAPNIQLDPPPSQLTLPQGPLITNVRISPEVSEAMLKYMAPVLAGATQSEGQFSLQLEGARVPLDDTKRADVAGQMVVHSVRVVPGPMARDWVALARQIEAIAKRTSPSQNQVTLLTVQDQQVNFKVAEGRVYHQGMQFQIGDVTMQSEGSVGFDETLQLVLRIPIQDRWIEGQQFLVGLKGQSLAIPVTGTLNRPQMDQRAIAGLSQQLMQKAAGAAIGGELNKAFDKLFRPKQ